MVWGIVLVASTIAVIWYWPGEEPEMSKMVLPELSLTDWMGVIINPSCG